VTRVRFFSVLTILAFLVPALHADTIVGTSGAGWQPFPATLNEKGTSAFWDNPSLDGSQKNIGYLLTNTGAFAGSTLGPGKLPYWGTATGAYDPSITFARSASSSSVAMLASIAGFAPGNSFGWYDTTLPITNSSNLHVIVKGVANPAAPAVFFTPSASYGYFLQAANGNIYFTQSALSTTGYKGHQNFAVFTTSTSSTNPTYFIGVEDLANGAGIASFEKNGDYNDMVVEIRPVPEPATLALTGAGVLSLAGLIRRKKGRKS
jgi:hypothetical protein